MTQSSSSSNPFSVPKSNSTSSSFQAENAWSTFEIMLEKRLEDIKPKTPSQIKAVGDSRNKTIVIAAMVGILGVIIIYVGILFIIDAESGKSFTATLMPIMTAIISGVLGYLSGEKSAK
ncbi:hypothetical protein JEK36_26420 [Klebsiella pneumoniae]|uniref:hypothetical protein n=1 Tax=Klebsiella pneumoniae TaxID=573 RepID=UPI0021187EF7|nr:hypothetical protein [Klebsiella pneumoniae]MCQ8497668.1 hypothetical protein [Klebsiella pneumoniae]HCE8967006.1 hypothetical protein [Klebsiella pneumoniae]HCG2939300.1 hypothetical protein [Klebsiella pneumoniae]HCH7873075.1 hypothetical protein [Klebsiella pneumoniae]